MNLPEHPALEAFGAVEVVIEIMNLLRPRIFAKPFQPIPLTFYPNQHFELLFGFPHLFSPRGQRFELGHITPSKSGFFMFMA
jgi:hypothetical protein